MVLKKIHSVKKIHRRLGTCLLMGLAVLVAGGFVSANETEEIVEYRDGLVTIRGDQLPLVDLLERISEFASVKIFLIGPPQVDACSLELVDIPFEDALRSILRNQSYAVFHVPGGSGSGIKVLEGNSIALQDGYGGRAAYETGNASRVSHANALRAGVERSMQKHIRKMVESEKAKAVGKGKKSERDSGTTEASDETT
jgi:hypothetical protein